MGPGLRRIDGGVREDHGDRDRLRGAGRHTGGEAGTADRETLRRQRRAHVPEEEREGRHAGCAAEAVEHRSRRRPLRHTDVFEEAG